MREFKTTSLADRVFEKLEDDIIMGVYPKGEILTELKLVEQLGVSRTPVRDALQRLEQEGLIKDTNKGSMVLGITEEDLMDIMDIRVQVEALASYYAAKNATPEEIEELRHIMDLDAFYAEKQDTEHMRQMDDQFHDTICSMSKRGVIRDTLLTLHRKTRRYRKLEKKEEARMSKMLDEHWKIYHAIADGDADAAKALTAQHIENAKKNMMERLNYHG